MNGYITADGVGAIDEDDFDDENALDGLGFSSKIKRHSPHRMLSRRHTAHVNFLQKHHMLRGLGAIDLKAKAMDYADRLGVRKYTDAIFGASETPAGMTIQAPPEPQPQPEESIPWTTIALYAVGGLLIWKVLTR